MREVMIPVTLKIGTVKELGFGGLKQECLTAEHNGVTYGINGCMAGLAAYN